MWRCSRWACSLDRTESTTTVPFRPIVHITHHKTSWTELIWLSSRITRTREHPQNWDCSKIAGIKKKLGALRQIYEQFGQKIRSVTHHHRPWTSVPVNYVHHASQGVNNRSKRYSMICPSGWKCARLGTTAMGHSSGFGQSFHIFSIGCKLSSVVIKPTLTCEMIYTSCAFIHRTNKFNMMSQTTSCTISSWICWLRKLRSITQSYFLLDSWPLGVSLSEINEKEAIDKRNLHLMGYAICIRSVSTHSSSRIAIDHPIWFVCQSKFK